MILHHQQTQGPFTELPLSSECEGLQKPLLSLSKAEPVAQVQHQFYSPL